MRPSMIANLAITYRCNSRCTTCNIWKIQDPQKDELTLGEIDSFFQENREFLKDVQSIQITGGEPYLREDLTEIIKKIHKALPMCTYWIPTNSLLPREICDTTREMLDELDGRGLGVSVSIDGDSEMHNHIRGTPGGYDKAIETIQRLRELREAYPELEITVGMTVTPKTVTQINQVAQFAQDHKADFSFRPVNFSGIYYRNKSGKIVEGYDMRSSRKQVHKLITNLVRTRGILKSVTRIAYMKGALEYMEKGRRTLRCTAASRSLFLDPYGNVYPCLFKEAKLGNIREQPLNEIWNSPAAKKTRMEINQLECPQCWVECEVYRELKNAPLRLISSVLTAVSVLLSSLLHGNRTRS